jgi:hypothetical protein
MDTAPKHLDCACVLHGSSYTWDYVENLYAMLTRNLTPPVKLHVFTEQSRPVPEPMIKHVLTEWPQLRSGKGWWYKMQMFNIAHVAGPLLYFDLDTVIVNNIDWIWAKPTNYFNTIRDFKHLWAPAHTGINSSVMWWDTRIFSSVWDHFSTSDLHNLQLKYRGDQDFLSHVIPENQRRYFETERVKSWRWECLDGGYNFKKRRHVTPGTGTHFLPDTSVLIFHGNPKPKDITDPLVLNYWKKTL